MSSTVRDQTLRCFMITVVKNEKGQSLLEFIIFLPLFISLIVVSYRISMSIMGSINQQKIVRGYYYSLIRNNSFVPTYGDLRGVNYSVSRTGMSFIGWRERKVGETPVAPCYSIGGFLGIEREECQDPWASTGTSQIRVQTAFGVCGATFSTGPGTGENKNFVRFFPTEDFVSATSGGCVYQ